jgi:hypothetical protein
MARHVITDLLALSAENTLKRVENRVKIVRQVITDQINHLSREDSEKRGK